MSCIYFQFSEMKGLRKFFSSILTFHGIRARFVSTKEYPLMIFKRPNNEGNVIKRQSRKRHHKSSCVMGIMRNECDLS